MFSQTFYVFWHCSSENPCVKLKAHISVAFNPSQMVMESFISYLSAANFSCVQNTLKYQTAYLRNITWYFWKHHCAVYFLVIKLRIFYL